MNLAKWNDWQTTLSIPEEEGGMAATVASFVALAAAPVVIVIKLEKACEFELTPAFRASMRIRIREKDYKATMTHVVRSWSTPPARGVFERRRHVCSKAPLRLFAAASRSR